MKTILASMLVAATIVAAVPARADSPKYCNEYANQAVISATMNMTHGCGFSGLRWAANYQTHYGWCLSAPHSAAVSERLARQRGIHQCHGGPTHNGR